MEKIKSLDKDTHAQRKLTAEELRRVIAPREGELQLLFALGIFTGLRLGDCVAMDWGKIDLERGFIRLMPHKTRKHKTWVYIPLRDRTGQPLPLARILAETPKAKRVGRVLPGLALEYLGDADHKGHPQYTVERVRRAFEAAGIETHGETGQRLPRLFAAREGFGMRLGDRQFPQPQP